MQLRRENEALRSALEAMQAVLLQDEGAGLAELLAHQQQLGEGGAGDAGPSTSAAAAPPAPGPAAAAGAAAAAAGSAKERIDQSYFESYSFFDIHREMLGDKVLRRQRAQQAAMLLQLSPGCA